MRSTGRNTKFEYPRSNRNAHTLEFKLGDEVLLDTGGGRVSNMTIVSINDSAMGPLYQLRPSNEVTEDTFDNVESQYNDMFVGEDYIRSNRLRNMGR